MTDDQEDKNFDRDIERYNEFPKSNPYNMLLANQKFFRGEILAYTIQIERKIDEYISKYFCASNIKKNQLNELLFFTERITLEMKRQMFAVLLKQNDSKFIKENPKFLNLLADIVPHRNIFAHLEVFTTHELKPGDKKKLMFKKYSNGVLKPKQYTIDDIADLQTNLMYIDFSLDVILQELPNLPE